MAETLAEKGRLRASQGRQLARTSLESQAGELQSLENRSKPVYSSHCFVVVAPGSPPRPTGNHHSLKDILVSPVKSAPSYGRKRPAGTDREPSSKDLFLHGMGRPGLGKRTPKSSMNLCSHLAKANPSKGESSSMPSVPLCELSPPASDRPLTSLGGSPGTRG